MTIDQIRTLRNGGVLNLFDKTSRHFIKIQLNKRENFVCWERYVSVDRINWVNHNMYLRLKEVNKIIQNKA